MCVGDELVGVGTKCFLGYHGWSTNALIKKEQKKLQDAQLLALTFMSCCDTTYFGNHAGQSGNHAEISPMPRGKVQHFKKQWIWIFVVLSGRELLELIRIHL